MRPLTPKDKKLGEGIRVRLTNREKEMLTERCRKEGYTNLSDFGRAKLLRKREIRRIEASQEFSELMGQMDFELNKSHPWPAEVLQALAKPINRR